MESRSYGLRIQRWAVASGAIFLVGLAAIHFSRREGTVSRAYRPPTYSDRAMDEASADPRFSTPPESALPVTPETSVRSEPSEETMRNPERLGSWLLEIPDADFEMMSPSTRDRHVSTVLQALSAQVEQDAQALARIEEFLNRVNGRVLSARNSKPE